MIVDWTDSLLTAVVIFFATVIQGVVGFGQAIIVMGVCPMFRDAKSASIVLSLVAVVSCTRVWWSVREDFKWRDWAKPAVGLSFGLPLGIYYFNRLDDAQLRIFIGITILVAVVLIAMINQLAFVKEWVKRKGIKPGWASGILTGFLGGFLGGAVAIPGPPMIVYGSFLLAAGFWKEREMKSQFTAFFGTIMIYRVVVLAMTGQIDVSHLADAGIALPGMFLGTWIGIRIFNMVPGKFFGWIVLGLLMVNGVALLVRV